MSSFRRAVSAGCFARCRSETLHTAEESAGPRGWRRTLVGRKHAVGHFIYSARGERPDCVDGGHGALGPPRQTGGTRSARLLLTQYRYGHA
jgi:hypothetical protein